MRTSRLQLSEARSFFAIESRIKFGIEPVRLERKDGSKWCVAHRKAATAFMQLPAIGNGRRDGFIRVARNYNRLASDPGKLFAPAFSSECPAASLKPLTGSRPAKYVLQLCRAIRVVSTVTASVATSPRP